MGMPAQTAERLRRLGKAAKNSQEAAADDREARNAAIIEADDEKWPLHEIARAVDMSVSHVQRIVAQGTADRQAAHQAALDRELIS